MNVVRGASRLAIAVVCASLGVLVPAPRAGAATAKHVFERIRHAGFHHAPLWPTYLPSRIADAAWYLASLRRRGPYPKTPVSAKNGFEAYYSYPFEGATGGGGFIRTDKRGLKYLVHYAKVDREPLHHIHLGGRKVLKFRPGTTGTDWAFSGPGGIYIFQSKDFGGPSQWTVGQMIRSLRPITRLDPP